MYTKTLQECSTELNRTRSNMKPSERVFEGHDSQRDVWIFSTLLLKIQYVYCFREQQTRTKTPTNPLSQKRRNYTKATSESTIQPRTDSATKNMSNENA